MQINNINYYWNYLSVTVDFFQKLLSHSSVPYQLLKFKLEGNIQNVNRRLIIFFSFIVLQLYDQHKSAKWYESISVNKCFM